MRVLIVGAGAVGRTIAENLVGSHEVVVIDVDPTVTETLPYELDVLTVRGDGTDLETLRNATISETDMVIACTDDDETNLVVCGTVKSQTDVFTIARVRRPSLVRTWRGARSAFGVDYLVCTDLLTADAIVRISGMPGAHAVDSFAAGLVRAAAFDIVPDSPVAGKFVRDADEYDSLTFAAIFRDDDLIIPRGDTVINPADRVVVIGNPESMNRFAMDQCVSDPSDMKDIAIVGGSEIGYQTARRFEERGYEPRLIERDRDRARELAEKLPNTIVLQHDGTDLEFLTEEHVDEADLVVAAVDSDAKSLLISLLAERMGVDRTIAVIESVEYATVFETVGVDVAINPREKTADEIVRFTRADHMQKITMLEQDRAEVVELTVREDGVLAGRPIAEAITDLPDDVVIGAVSRAGDRVTPRGETVLKPGDHLVAFAATSVVDDLVEAI